jgi:purine-cytosine permease-like protein
LGALYPLSVANWQRKYSLLPPGLTAVAAVYLAFRAGAALAALFAEELGLVLEVAAAEAEAVAARYSKAGVPARVIGKVCMCPAIVKSK